MADFIIFIAIIIGVIVFLKKQDKQAKRKWQHEELIRKHSLKEPIEKHAFELDPHINPDDSEIIQTSTRTRKSLYSYEPNDETWPFEKKPLLTPSEKKFFQILKSALPDNAVYIQVPLSQMMRVKKGNDFKMWNNRINRMSVDFVVCDQHTNILAAIELDDPSHDNIKRQADDAKKDKALTCADIKIIRWRVESMPSAEIIREKVLNQAIRL